jgi:hypothetical protein
MASGSANRRASSAGHRHETAEEGGMAEGGGLDAGGEEDPECKETEVEEDDGAVRRDEARAVPVPSMSDESMECT